MCTTAVCCFFPLGFAWDVNYLVAIKVIIPCLTQIYMCVLCLVMQITELLPNLLLIQPKVFEDHRGHFFESYRQDALHDFGVDPHFVQDNQSLSNKGILRGLHYQVKPYDQGKLVRVITGSVLDVAVDIRKQSPTYGQHVARLLSAENKEMMYIPPGFAHGFVTLQDHTIFLYKCTNYYHPQSEGGIKWDSKSLNIKWNLSQYGIDNPILSAKDLVLPDFDGFDSPFD
jgi:dTDP-4-dehydrorhamnose 3,5-epimerase